jgi:hypothetical protein
LPTLNAYLHNEFRIFAPALCTHAVFSSTTVYEIPGPPCPDASFPFSNLEDMTNASIAIWNAPKRVIDIYMNYCRIPINN